MPSSAGRLADQSPAFLLRQPPAWMAQYVGIPFKEKGRDRDGADCWGLLRLLYLEQFGVELPMYLDGYAGTERQADLVDIARLIADRPPEWREVKPGEERLCDAVLFMVGKLPVHVALVAARSSMLHAFVGVDSTIERYDSPGWAPRLIGFFRWEGAGG